MANIVEKSPILLASLQEEQNISEVTSDASPENTQCDALYQAAVSANQCFAYKAYSNACSTHALAPIADGYIDTFCQASKAPSLEQNQTISDENKALNRIIAAFDEKSECVDTVKNGCLNQKISEIRSFLNNYPNSYKRDYVEFLLGKSLFEKRDFKVAAQIFLGNYRRNPDAFHSSDALVSLGATLLELNQKNAACSLLKRIKEEHPLATDAIENSNLLISNECKK